MATPRAQHFFVIVNYNAGRDIVTCIRSIFASRGIDAPRIIVVDNASADHSTDNCKKLFPALIYIHNSHNIGFAAAANLGIRYAMDRDATTVTLCNPDAILDADCMRRVYAAMHSRDVHVASPVIYKDACCRTVWFSGGAIRWWRMRAVHTARVTLPSNTVLTDTDYITGCVMTIDRRVFDAIGLFDERFFLYYEDADFSLRARRAGFTLGVVTDAAALHAEVSERAPEHKLYFLVLSGLLFFRKHATVCTIWRFRALLFLRRAKNRYDRRRNAPRATIVYHAFRDYAARTHR